MARITYRPDFVESLTHLIRPRKCSKFHGHPEYDKDKTETPAFEVLKEILKAQYLHGSTTQSGFIKGDKRAVCFTETPLTHIRYLVEGPLKRYAPYGIIIRKREVFKNGGRPVLYLPDSEAGWVPDDQRWRHVQFDLSSELHPVDFTFEREWRVQGDLQLKSVAGFYVLVATSIEADELLKFVYPAGAKGPAGIFILEHLRTMM